MLFSSPVFLSFFLPLSIAAYFLLPFRSVALLVLSLAFYAWGEPVVVWLLVAVILVNYGLGLLIDNGGAGSRRLWLIVGLAANLLVLIIFKYSAFIATNVNAGLDALGIAPLTVPHLPLPLGISFFTFQAISYLVDIYRGDVHAERNLIRMGVFKAFFPQLIAGPIVRYREIAGELKSRNVSSDDFMIGMERFTIGLGKKLLIADPLSIAVDRIFATSTDLLPAPLAWMGVVSFGLQIYFDFSGYSDMAIGLARMFGFHFPENFDLPYDSKSVQEFWRRWHMTLSRWFRDYLYIPLGGNRRGAFRTSLNLWIVFATTGFWHGASWNFLIWGLWHGALLALERTSFGRFMERMPSLVRRTYLLVAVLLGWVWFRAQSLDDALGYFSALFFGGFSGALTGILRVYNPALLLALAAGLVFAFASATWLSRLLAYRPQGDALPCGIVQDVTRTVVIFAVATVALSASAASTLQAFLYFRF
ncbi:MBOAT family protein [Rhizobium ruizarguesonis]|uniref:MBOAT family O-acyltransferase n=1 Tax=Rhizobium ruizarguesonis TaxID=2081791 RepID=UPI0010305227|nr:MBOAT family protein [Rhizobium ruizarguesonis]TAU03835.1 MBOAT family protein [Rhizobium ruizarguesonis]